MSLSVDNFIFGIGSVFNEKNPMGTSKYTITDIDAVTSRCSDHSNRNRPDRSRYMTANDVLKTSKIYLATQLLLNVVYMVT